MKREPFVLDGSIAPSWQDRPATPAAHPTGNSGYLPSGVVLGERATALLRRYLNDSGLADWQIVIHSEMIWHDIDEHLPALGESSAQWESLPPLTLAGQQPAAASRHAGGAMTQFLEPGVLRLRRFPVVMARWNVYSTFHSTWCGLYLAAAPSLHGLNALRDRLIELRRLSAQKVWQIVTGESWMDHNMPREALATWDDLVLEPALRKRLEIEIGGFFSDPVARLHRELQVPYRRGVLLHGPPGNGKTSIIRVIGAVHMDVPAIVLRPGGDFGDSEFQRLVDEWREQAPAILVIEDLDWLLPRISVSTFLNRIDGLERNDAGMLLVATTNHPESLDPAINNRPGRFDVVLEVPAPSRALRLDYLQRSILGQRPGCLPLETIARDTEDLSFAHLREIINLSGLIAVRAGRHERAESDVLEATAIVAQGHHAAQRGFANPPPSPFALAELARHRKRAAR